ncbi:RNA-binding protein 48 [Plakobranchus ocellatus]|uniref:RNA-binding protein 48 n=1 Tax=Plakobranchus ocellatus TaxID=259542 RepID=A0AAV4DQU0_9GAST|nr:RNA-binding protein 48 [Plakobranchus ocellatus]
MEVPVHHLKQEVCTSRPPYREGRHAKAVKVYTVNNESIYLIIQGVPSVGASGELTKLCASFGQVEELKALDEYPCEEYTEVYLVKFKKIQSSRFAKRKLDDYSFFGGNLHVCYAPEYESVQETRAKLQDRRQVISKKIRQHFNERAKHQQERKPDIHTKSSTESASLTISVPTSQASLLQEGLEFPSSYNISNLSEHNTTSSAESLPAFQHNTYHKVESFPNASMNVQESVRLQSDSNPEYDVFQLPLPPKSVGNSQFLKRSIDWKKYEYSKVPTAHATLPLGYDGRVMNPVHEAVLRSTTSDVSSTASVKEESSRQPQSSQIIVKNYKVSKPALKFVPRQAVKTTAVHQSTTSSKVSNTSSSNDELRKNAFRLGKVQGPEEGPGRKRPLPTAAQKSVNDTILSIRSKISKVGSIK